MHKIDVPVMMIGGALAAVGVILLLLVMSSSGIVAELKRARESVVAKIGQGPEQVVLRGRVVPSPQGTFPSPVMQLPAVWSSQVLSTRLGNVLRTEHFSKGVAFFLDDGSGQPALIVPDEAKSELKTRCQESWDGALRIASPVVERWLWAQGPTQAAQLRSGAQRELAETALCPGDTVTVLGTARRGPDGAVVLRSERTLTGGLHFFDKSRAELMGSSSTKKTAGLVLLVTGLLALGGGYAAFESAERAASAKSKEKHEQEQEEVEEALSKWKSIKADVKKRDHVVETDVKIKKKGAVRLHWLEAKDDPGETSFKPCEAIADGKGSLAGNSFCKSLPYVAIVRQRAIDEPSVDVAARKFNGGLFEGEALVYDLKSGKHLGGIVLTVKNAESMDIPNDQKDKAAWVRTELMRRVAKKTLEEVDEAGAK